MNKVNNSEKKHAVKKLLKTGAILALAAGAGYLIGNKEARTTLVNFGKTAWGKVFGKKTTSAKPQHGYGYDNKSRNLNK